MQYLYACLIFVLAIAAISLFFPNIKSIKAEELSLRRRENDRIYPGESANSPFAKNPEVFRVVPDEKIDSVRIVDVQIPFVSMVIFLVKLSIAAIPAGLILGAILLFFQIFFSPLILELFGRSIP